MTEEKNRFEKTQPVRHPLAVVSQSEDKIKINKQLYKILVNKNSAIDLDMIRRKYDPYLDQYDFIVGDISSDHLRLKGFYKDIVRTAIDKKEKAIADYIIEYCNPGTAYFVLELISPVHNYSQMKDFHKKPHKKRHHHNKNDNFSKRRVHKTKIPKKKSVAVTRNRRNSHSFVIKKRED